MRESDISSPEEASAEASSSRPGGTGHGSKRLLQRGALAAFLLSGLIPTTPVAAESESEAEAAEPKGAEVTLGERIVVTASRFEQPLAETPAHVALLDQETIRSSAALTTADLLRDVAGFSLLRADSSLVAHPTTQSISLRGVGGTGASRALVLLDGIPFNDGYAGWVSWNMVPTESLEAIEVTKGGGSAVWGNLALSGVIDLRTQTPDAARLDLRLRGGERGLAEADFSGGARFGDLNSTGGSGDGFASSLFGRVGRFEFDGYPVVAPEERGSIDESLWTEATTAYLSWTRPTSASGELKINAGYLDEERGSGTPLTFNTTERFLGSIGWQQVTDGGVWSLRAHTQQSTFTNFIATAAPDRNSEVPAVDQFDIPASVFGASFLYSRDLGAEDRHGLSLGLDTQLVDGENNENFLRIGDQLVRQRQAGGEQLLAGLFLSDRITLDERTSLELTARVDRWEKTNGSLFIFDRRNDNVLADVDYEDGEETQFSPRVAFARQLTDRASLRASAYAGFRAPTVNELYKPFRLPGGVVNEANPELVPETLVGAELGFDWSRPGLFARLTAFWNEVDDPVINLTLANAGPGGGFIAPCGFVPPNGVCRQRTNIGQQRAFGIEFDLNGRFADRWSWGLNGVLSDLEVTEAPGAPQLIGLEPRLIPETTLNGRLEWRDPRWFDAALRVRSIGERFADDPNQFELDTQTLVDLTFARKLNSRIVLDLAVQNVFDEESVVDQSPALTRVGPPRLVQAGLRIALGSN